MPICFVIQPFDSGKFDKRFNDIYRPAIEAAGLEAYRVDLDPGVLVPIDAIENGIRESVLCLADITADNPNVWYELGYAFASGRPVVMVCSEERTGKKYPFDIQHRSIIPYHADSPSDFEKLRSDLSAKIAAILKHAAVLNRLVESGPVAPVHGLSQIEHLVLAVMAGEVYTPNLVTRRESIKREVERAGITTMGFNLAAHRLEGKRLIMYQGLSNPDGSREPGLFITDSGWKWIDENHSSFVLNAKR